MMRHFFSFAVVFCLVTGLLKSTQHDSFVEEAFQEVEEIAKRLDGRYTDIMFLGDGMQSTVFLAKDSKGDGVAIKLVKDRTIRMIGKSIVENEYRTYLTLSEIPAVRRIYEIMDDDVLVMEYISGYPLETVFNEYFDDSSFDKAIIERWIKDLFVLTKQIIDLGVIPVDLDVVNVLVQKQDMSLRIIDMADYIDLNQYVGVKEPFQMYGGEVILGFNEEGDHLVTPEFFTYITCKDIFDLTNHFLNALGKETLGDEYLPNKELFSEPVTTYEGLQHIHTLLKEYVLHLEQAVISRNRASSS